MKLNKLFLGMAMSLGLFACNSELEEGGIKNEEKGNTYVAFSLDFKKDVSRADATTPGTTEESYINSAYIMMADESGNIKKTLVCKRNTSNADQWDVTGGEYTSNKYVMSVDEGGTYAFYAVINPETGKEPTGGTIASYFKTKKVLTTTAVTAANQFMMSSVEEIKLQVKEGISKETAIAGTDAETNNITIKVERVSAKVTVTCPSAAMPSLKYGGTLVNLSYELKQGAENCFYMRNGVIDDNTYGYATTQRIVEFGKTSAEVTADYCLENTHTITPNEYWQKNTTYVVVKATLIPGLVVDCENGGTKNNTKTAAESFYVVSTGDLAGNYILKSDLDTYQQTNPGKYPTGVNTISGEYVSGVCHFPPIWFGQENLNVDQTAPVVRNTWYNLNIKEIKLPGFPSEITPEENTRLEPATHVGVTVQIMDWTVKNHEVELQ